MWGRGPNEAPKTACGQASQGLSHQGTWWSGCFLKFSCDGKFLLITSRLVVDSGSSRQSPQRDWGTPAPFPQHRNQILGGGEMEGPMCPESQGESTVTQSCHWGTRVWATSRGSHWLSAPDSTVLHRTSNFSLGFTVKMEKCGINLPYSMLLTSLRF